ncbi:TRAM domain-containing protein [uncultured Bifidobacterium sp.]|uniref:class I SAM-dependent RNA methyltransferase n=1 Tax=uncultured Bifidobacterium sp. TaxID=165187 RepID=UPI0028DBB788|nr:TRAM domain-containing protein [uncultured Bifidobacterium sp.]
MQATVRIERYADQGRCVAHIDGRVVFVRFALPAELVTVELDEPHEREDRFWTGEVVAVQEPNPERREPVWPLAGPLSSGGGVGGADLVHVSLPGQLAWKAATIREQMTRLGHLDPGPVTVERMPGDEESRGLHWRTRIDLVADVEGRPSMRRRGSHDPVAVDDMPLATRTVLDAARDAHLWAGGFPAGTRLRVVAAGTPGSSSTASSSSRPESGEADSVGPDRRRAVLVGGKVVLGSPTIRETVVLPEGSFDYDVSASGFWQVHRLAPATLAGHVLSLVRRALDGVDRAAVWDLYSGSGLFTLPLAGFAADDSRVLAIEGVREAAKDARRNLAAAGLDDRAVVRCGDVARVLRGVASGHDRGMGRAETAALAHPDVVVLDPPRSGAGAQVCRAMAAAGARHIVYVACDPTSLARDTATMTTLGYRLADIHAFDLYPLTHHVETVAWFARGGR